MSEGKGYGVFGRAWLLSIRMTEDWKFWGLERWVWAISKRRESIEKMEVPRSSLGFHFRSLTSRPSTVEIFTSTNIIGGMPADE